MNAKDLLLVALVAIVTTTIVETQLIYDEAQVCSDPHPACYSGTSCSHQGECGAGKTCCVTDCGGVCLSKEDIPGKQRCGSQPSQCESGIQLCDSMGNVCTDPSTTCCVTDCSNYGIPVEAECIPDYRLDRRPINCSPFTFSCGPEKYCSSQSECGPAATCCRTACGGKCRYNVEYSVY